MFDIIPLRVLPPIVMGMIIYPMAGLVSGWSEFFSFILVLVLFNLTSAALCLFIGIIFQGSGVANLIGTRVLERRRWSCHHFWYRVLFIKLTTGVFIVLAYGAMHVLLVEKR